MTRNNLALVAIVGFFVVALGAIKIVQVSRLGDAPPLEPIVVYEVLPHPYFEEVTRGAKAFEAQTHVPVRIVVGQESSQANLNTNIDSLYAVGHKAFALYPVDPAGCRGVFERLKAGGRYAVAYGAQPEAGSATAFAVATDTRGSATQATEVLIGLMGGQGRILNVLESMTDANTKIRRDAIEATVARYPKVSIIDTIGDINSEQEGRTKIESALVARQGQIDGVICTGYNTTVAAALLLAERNARDGAKRIRFVGIDTDPRVLTAIREDRIDATMAQNPYAQGYISCALLKLMLDGWTPLTPYQFIDSGSVVLTRSNVDSFDAEARQATARLAGELQTRYLRPPATAAAP